MSGSTGPQGNRPARLGPAGHAAGVERGARSQGRPHASAGGDPLRGRDHMRAVVYDHYGPPDVLHLEDVAQPIPKDDEVLVRIHATTVNRADCATREANRRSGLAVSLLSRSISGLRPPRPRMLR